jgi:hypothetical protein
VLDPEDLIKVKVEAAVEMQRVLAAIEADARVRAEG